MKDLKQKHAIGNQRVKTGETSQNKKQTNKQTNTQQPQNTFATAGL